MEVHINQLCSQGQLTDAVGIDLRKKKENESCIFLVVFYLQLYFEVAFFYLCCIFNSCQGTYSVPGATTSRLQIPRDFWQVLAMQDDGHLATSQNPRTQTVP